MVIGAGGTGGHIYPGLATADALRRAAPDAEITFIGTPKGLEQRLIPAAGYPLELVDMLPWGGVRSSAMFGVALARSSQQAGRVLGRLRPDVVIGMGGYPSLPAVVAARRRRVPIVIHASGAIAGRANLLAARLTRNVALSFASSARSFPRHDVRVTGMPLSAGLAGFSRESLRPVGRAEYGVDKRTTLVFVSGGSQGSVRLNELAIALGERWAARDDVVILLKAGAAHIDAVTDQLAASDAGRVVRAVRYLDRIDTAYAAADIAISRAGAATVAELATCGLPALLVPYPFAPVVHEQTANARVLSDVGAADIVEDGGATADVVGPRVEALIGSDRLAAMAAAAVSTTHAGAADALARWALQLANPQKNGLGTSTT